MSGNTDPEQLRSRLHPRLPLLIRVTGYRLFTIALIIAFGTAKAVVSYQGKTIISTTLDWVMGVLLAIGLFLLGLYENVDPPILPWFFHRDYSLQIIRGFRRAIIAIIVVLPMGGIAMYTWLAYEYFTTPDHNTRHTVSAVLFGLMAIFGVWGFLFMCYSEINAP